MSRLFTMHQRFMLYFDHNATSPLSPEAREAWLDAADNLIGNPSSPHRIGARADAALEGARQKLARILGCDMAEIVWTSGATEASNTVLHHIRYAQRQGEVWVSAIEHPCVLHPSTFHYLGAQRLIPATRSGVVDLDWLADNLKKNRPDLVAVMGANNETGVIQPWREVLALCRERGVPFFCDAVQWIGKLPAAGLGQCDFVSGSAHKYGGPKGVGFLKAPADMLPLLIGGKQEDGRRAGTENVPGVMAMLAALEHREKMLAAGEHEKRAAWRRKFEKGLLANLPGTEVVGVADRLWNTVSALMPDVGCRQRWVVRLDKFGCAASTGSACSSGREEPSHVLAAMGYAQATTDRVLRFSSGWETAEQDWQELLQGLIKTMASFGK